MADQRAVRILAPLDEHLVVAHVVARSSLFLRMAWQEVGDGLRLRVLRREVECDASPVQGAEHSLEAEANVGVLHERRDAVGGRGAAFEALLDEGLKRAVRSYLEDHMGSVFPPHRVHRGSETDRLADVGPPVGAVQALHYVTGD